MEKRVGAMFANDVVYICTVYCVLAVLIYSHSVENVESSVVQRRRGDRGRKLWSHHKAFIQAILLMHNVRYSLNHL